MRYVSSTTKRAWSSSGMRAVKAVVAALVLALGAALPGAGHAAEWVPGTPALVADLDTGRVLYAENATDPWFPASLTKLMTAYVALQEVRAGRIRMDTLLTVSPAAAAQPPSKMGFKAGSQIRLDNALLIIMVKSANDVAATIAEGIAGSVDDFSAHMNAHAARLGMRDSHFTNPHGLPDLRKRTSARDMALLASALWREFPEQRALFGLDSINFGSTVMRNHNGLIGRYAGATGMKTGYICSSGFNVVATAERNGRRLVTIVMGAPNAAERTAKSASLFEYGFSTGGWFGTQLADMPRSAKATPVDLRPIICGRQPPSGESDRDTGAVRAGNMPGMAGGQALAFAGGAAATRLPEVELPARGPARPISVWLGPTPPGAATALAGPTSVPVARAVPIPPRRPAI
jgi:D-alanyl-D-alanine carboxypeptidase